MDENDVNFAWNLRCWTGGEKDLWFQVMVWSIAALSSGSDKSLIIVERERRREGRLKNIDSRDKAIDILQFFFSFLFFNWSLTGCFQGKITKWWMLSIKGKNKVSCLPEKKKLITKSGAKLRSQSEEWIFDKSGFFNLATQIDIKRDDRKYWLGLRSYDEAHNSQIKLFYRQKAAPVCTRLLFITLHSFTNIELFTEFFSYSTLSILCVGG